MRLSKQGRKRRNTKAWIFVLLLFLLSFSYTAGFFYKGEREVFSYKEEPGQIWVERKKIWGSTRIELEEYLEGMMAATIPGEYELETMKAQAVILRSHCMSKVIHKDGRKVIEEEEVEEYYFSTKEREYYWGKNYEAYQKKIEQAIEETKGKVILYEDQVIEPPFFRVGNGKTRNPADYPVAGREYQYIKQAECEHDMNYSEYITYIDLSGKEFLEKINSLKKTKGKESGKITLIRDSAEYVKEIYLGEEYIPVDEFATTFALPGTCFTIEKIDDKIQFKIMGKGHGLGFSQYQADCLAKEGGKMEDLLNYFFQGIKVERMI